MWVIQHISKAALLKNANRIAAATDETGLLDNTQGVCENVLIRLELLIASYAENALRLTDCKMQYIVGGIYNSM